MTAAEQLRIRITVKMEMEPERAWTPAEMAEALSVPVPAVRAAIKKLEDQGLLSRTSVTPVLRLRLSRLVQEGR